LSINPEGGEERGDPGLPGLGEARSGEGKLRLGCKIFLLFDGEFLLKPWLTCPFNLFASKISLLLFPLTLDMSFIMIGLWIEVELDLLLYRSTLMFFSFLSSVSSLISVIGISITATGSDSESEPVNLTLDPLSGSILFV